MRNQESNMFEIKSEVKASEKQPCNNSNSNADNNDPHNNNSNDSSKNKMEATGKDGAPPTILGSASLVGGGPGSSSGVNHGSKRFSPERNAATRASSLRKKMEGLTIGSSIKNAGGFARWSPVPSPTAVRAPLSPSPEPATTSSAKPSDPGRGSGGGSTQRDSMDGSAGAQSVRRHTGDDRRWEAIRQAGAGEGPLGLGHFRLLKRLGYGDIGSVYLVELRGTGAFFAMKVMDKASLESRNKLLRAKTEREILGLLDHPFLPTLYSHFETDKFYCLVMEYCSGGNLHSLRQRQPHKHFTEQASRFYASEVLLALEYLHMLGVVYRDLKPENVLVREGGHIMLSDFDLSLQCAVSPTLVKSSSVHGGGGGFLLETGSPVQGCIQPSSFFPRILPRKNRKSKSDFGLGGSGTLPEFMAEPTNARSMSFVGTHEYLAPEIIRGEGHGSAVDWWTFGIFLYELMYGVTPFKGSGNRATLFNVVGQPLRFPEVPSVSSAARDLIKGLLVKEPQKRIAYRRGATEIKQHPFFDGMNWALVRSAPPPHVPDPVDFGQYDSKEVTNMEKKVKAVQGGGVAGGGGNKSSGSDSSYLDFEYF